MKSILVIFGVLGCLITGCFVGVFVEKNELMYSRSPTTIYVANSDLKLSNGGVVPKGSQLFYDDSFAEGFVRLKLYVNTEYLDDFTIKKDPRSRLVTPYWARNDLIKSEE